MVLNAVLTVVLSQAMLATATLVGAIRTLALVLATRLMNLIRGSYVRPGIDQHFSNLLFSVDGTAASHGTQHAGATDTAGGNSRSTNAGPYDSGVTDKLDPRYV